MGKPDHARVEFYARQVSSYVERAADCVEVERQDEFLWHVRRATEAVLLALLASQGEQDPKPGETSLEKLRALLKDLPQTPFDVRADLDAVRNNCNMGSHALLQSQSATASGGPVSVAAKVRKHFPEVLEWARRQPLLENLLDRRLGEWIVAIKSGSGRSRMQQVLDVQTVMIRESRRRFGQGVALGFGGAVLFAVGAWFGVWALGLSSASSRSSPPTAVTELPYESAPSFASQRQPAVEDAARVMTIVSIPAPHDPERRADSSTEPSSTTQGLRSGDCPRETLWVAATTVDTLEAPADRPYWPNTRRAARPGRVPAFCIDRMRIRAEQYQQCVSVGLCQWRGREEAGSTPATHLFASDADGYCRWRGESLGLEGALASIVEWEALARSIRSETLATFDVASSQPLFEWAYDPAYPSLWSMAPLSGERMTRERLVRQSGSGPRWSWNHAREDNGAGAVAFRCRFRRSG